MLHILSCTDSTDPPVLTSAAACRDGIISVTFITLGTLASGHCQTGVRYAHNMMLEQSVLSLASHTRHFGLCATCFFGLFLLEDIHCLEFSFSWAIPYFSDETCFISLKFQRRLGVSAVYGKFHLQPVQHRCLSLCGVRNPNSISMKKNYFFFPLLAQICFFFLNFVAHKIVRFS